MFDFKIDQIPLNYDYNQNIAQRWILKLAPNI